MTRDEALSSLGLDRGASQAQIKAAYRQAAFWCHPDKNPGNRVAENTFKRIAAAYEVLKENGGGCGGGDSGRNGNGDGRAARERSAADRAARERAAAERAAAKKAAEEREAAERRREAEKARIRAEAARRAHCVRCGKFRELVVAVSKRRVCNDCLQAENVPDSVVRADLARLPAKLKELEAFAYDPKNFPKQEPSETKIVEGDGGTSAFYQDEEYWFWEEAPGSWAQAEIVRGERRIIKRGCPTKEDAMKYFRNHKIKDAFQKVISWRWVEGFTPGLGTVYVTHDWRAFVAQGERKGWSLRRPWSLFIILHGKLGLVRADFPTAEAAMNFSG